MKSKRSTQRITEISDVIQELLIDQKTVFKQTKLNAKGFFFLPQVTLNNVEVCSENITTLKRNLEVSYTVSYLSSIHSFPHNLDFILSLLE